MLFFGIIRMRSSDEGGQSLVSRGCMQLLGSWVQEVVPVYIMMMVFIIEELPSIESSIHFSYII